MGYLILGFAQPLPASTSSSAMAAPATTIAAALTPCRSSGRSSTGPGALAPFSAPPPCVSWNPQVKVPGPLKTPFVGPRTAFPVPARIRTPHGTRSGNSTTVRAAVSVGDKLPDATLSYLDKEDKIQTIRVSDLTRGKKVVLFAVPGAFTPTCSQKHLPGFIEKADELRAKGVQTIACISVNDAFVMKAWGEKLNAGDKVLLLADGNGEFTRALGFSLDLSDKPAGLGVRSRRYALLAEDGVVKVLNLEEGGAFTISGAEDILKAL